MSPDHHMLGDIGVTRRPRLLFLARPFPPLRATACVRTWNIAKYLSRLGWEITVVTPHPSVWRHVDNAQATEEVCHKEQIGRILTGHPWPCLAPDLLNTSNHGLGWFAGGICRRIAQHLGFDGSIGWMRSAERFCSTLRSTDVDIILATGSPFSSFRLARRLSGRLKRPYVLDYRDPWSGNPHSGHATRPSSSVQEEAIVLADSSAVTIVSPSWAKELARRFGIESKIHVITNGYDPEELRTVASHDFGHLAIVYTGNFYPPKRVITPVMAALKGLKQASGGLPDWRFHYYGGQQAHVMAEARRFGVMDRVIVHGSVPRAEALAALRGAAVSVVITAVCKASQPEDRGIVPAKVFEAIGLGTRVLLVAPLDSDTRRMGGDGAEGLLSGVNGEDVGTMTAILKDAVGDGLSSVTPLMHYAWPDIAQRLDQVLRRVVERPSPWQPGPEACCGSSVVA